MDKIELVPINEALNAKRQVKKSKVVQEVEETLKKLPEGQAGKIIAKTEKPQTVKNIVTVKRKGDTIYFYKESEK